MRKSLFFSTIITAAAIMVAHSLVAQNTTPYWSVTGNSNASGASKLGTSNAMPLNLVTNNTSQVYITATGNVGLGSMTPSQKLHVAGNTYISGTVGIGTLTPTEKLQVAGNTLVTGNSIVLGSVGIGTRQPSYKLEVQGGATNAIAGYSNSTGILGKGSYIGVYGNSSYIGVYGASPSGIGGYFYSATGTGLYARTDRSDKYYAAMFQGNIYATGLYSSSDKNLKKNVEELEGAMAIINQLKPRNYEFRQDGKYAALHLPEGRHYGLLAQELEKVLPGLVKESHLPIMEPPTEPIAASEVVTAAVSREKMDEPFTAKAVNYTELIPILIKALQEQDQKIEHQLQQIQELKNLISRISKGENISTRSNSAELLQNIPNPVRGSTSISYNVPDGEGRAQLVVTDALGRTIKTLQLNQSGMVHFNVSNLSSGVYTYSLVIDNKVVQTKKMTVER